MNVPVSFSAEVNVLAPSADAFITADSVPDAPLKKFDAVEVSMVDVEVYLLTVDVSQESPADSDVNDDVLSSADAHRCGLVPCAESDMVIDFDDNPAGADGTAFMVNVTVSESV